VRKTTESYPHRAVCVVAIGVDRDRGRESLARQGTACTSYICGCTQQVVLHAATQAELYARARVSRVLARVN
jgi:hypothetical protein